MSHSSTLYDAIITLIPNYKKNSTRKAEHKPSSFMNIDAKHSKQNISKTISVIHAIYHDEVTFTSKNAC